jgi:hypothetical protein
MKKKRVLGLLLIIFLILSAFTLFSCKKSPAYPEEEIIGEARRLIKEAEKINSIYFGSGIPYLDEGEGNYKKADPAWLSENRIETTDDLREMTTKVYSKEYSEYLFEIMLASVKTDTAVASYASYIDTDAGILVYTKRTDYIQGELEYHLDKISVEENTKERVRVSVSVTVTNEEGSSQERKKSFNMVKTGESWYLDSGTFLTYNNQTSEK